MLQTLKIGIRPSQLALKQAQEVIGLLKGINPSFTFSVHKIYTAGDKDKVTPLSEVEGSDFFTREIDTALLDAEIDIAVHSSKDLPDILPEGLVVAWESRSLSPYECLVSRNNLKLSQLPGGWRIGLSSQRRKNKIQGLRSDLEIVDIRGNIEVRLAFLDTKKIDALIIAHAAMLRLGLEERIAQILPLDVFPAHAKQGRLSLVVREEMWEKVKFILSAQAPVIGN